MIEFYFYEFKYCMSALENSKLRLLFLTHVTKFHDFFMGGGGVKK